MGEDEYIHIKGAREHNLRNLDVRIPRGKLVVVTGVSGSGKSSLAFDTLYAEGYRKYIDSLSTRARQVLDQVKRPDVDFIHGLSPVIAIEQLASAATNPRSTVGTATEVADYARLLWALCGEEFCPLDGAPIVRRSLDDCIGRIYQEPEGSRLMILAPYMTGKPSVLREEIPRLRQRGFQRLRVNGEIKLIDVPSLLPSGNAPTQLDIVIDRVVVAPDQRSRIADSLELAFREGGDRALILTQTDRDGPFSEFSLSQNLSCAQCGIVYDPISPRTFSYNHLDGACPDCGGVGRTMQFSDELIVPDPSKTVRGGAIKPWRIGSKSMIIRHNALLKQLAEQLPFDPRKPWVELPEETRQTILHGSGDRLFKFKLKAGNSKPEEMPFPGVIPDLEQLQRESSSDGFRARMMAYQVSSVCQRCKGRRLNARAMNVLLGGLDYASFMNMDLDAARDWVEKLPERAPVVERVQDAYQGLRQRLSFLNEVGLHYLTLDREYATLSGGESQRVRLATQLGMGLVGVLYILDEPTIGLHPHDTRRLLETLLQLRDRGNAVVVVEHDEDIIRAADYLLELGPGAGEAGGELIFEGTPAEAKRSSRSRTGPFLSGKLTVERNTERRSPGRGWVTVRGAHEHNLRDIDVRFPVGLLTVVTGVSGSGKSTLVNEILANAAAMKLNRAKTIPGRHRGIDGLDHFSTLVRVDQSPIGQSPRSNPATYTKLFDQLRALYSQAPLARVRGYSPSRFSFNVPGGRCERCQGEGQIRMDMQFLADVYAECPSCHGARYNRETLEVRFKGINIAEALELTVSEALEVFRNQPKLVAKLETLQAVGLGYVRLGQAANTLSGGEAQRIKLSLELSRRNQGDALYILDEPTTGLHWIDIQHLVDLLFRLRDAGNTIIIIEHNLDVIRLADWVVDLGPGGGKEGGDLIYSGPVDGLKAVEQSLTAQSLRGCPKAAGPAGR